MKEVDDLKKQRDNTQTSALQLDKIVKEKQKEIEKLQRQKEELQINGLRQETLFKLEIERLNQYIDFYKDLIERQNKDLERLNNIIDELEKYLEWSIGQDMYRLDFKIILDKLQELKGRISNEV